MQPDSRPSAAQQAKETLLRALEQLESAQDDLGGEPDRVDLVVVYSIGHDAGEGGYHEIGGWSATAGPKWLHAAMLRRAADAQDDTYAAIDDLPDEDDDEEPKHGE